MASTATPRVFPSIVGGSSLPHYQEGGIVPGIGAQLAVVHGGETIIPKNKGIGIPLVRPITINITGNSFMSDEEAAEKIVDIIIERLKTQMRFVY